VKRWERAEEARVEVVKAAARVEARAETTPVLLATPQEKVAATLLGKRIGQSEPSLFLENNNLKAVDIE
jgi:hypothetical protein